MIRGKWRLEAERPGEAEARFNRAPDDDPGKALIGHGAESLGSPSASIGPRTMIRGKPFLQDLRDLDLLIASIGPRTMIRGK